MAEYILTNKAVEDLSNIWDYTHDYWSKQQADSYYWGLLQTCQKISDNPAIGKRYDEIGQSIFGYLYKKHIIFYTIVNRERVQIVRILHSRMDLKNRLKE